MKQLSFNFTMAEPTGGSIKHTTNLPSSPLRPFPSPPPRLISFHIPPVLKPMADELAAEEPPVHPVWKKIEQTGKHFIVRTSSLDDLSELADWARVALAEPPRKLSKSERQAFQSMLDRAVRFAEIVPLGSCHCIATKWREKPLKGDAKGFAIGSLRETSSRAPWRTKARTMNNCKEPC